MLGYVLIVTVCGFGCVESSHYDQFQTSQACDDARRVAQRVAEEELRFEPFYPRSAHWRDRPMRMAICVQGRTFQGGQRWSSTGVDSQTPAFPPDGFTQ